MARKKLAGIGAAFGMLLLILDGKTALNGAQDGIALCIRTVIPALFPFFVLSPLLMGNLSPGFLKPLGRLCRMPAGAEGLLLVAFLGGYPTGAQAVALAYEAGQIDKTQADRLLGFCSNAGPSFLFGMISPAFGNAIYGWLLWAVHIVSAILVALVLPGGTGSGANIQLPQVSLSEALNRAVKTMGLVCSWVVLFRVIIRFLERWVLWLLPKQWQVLLMGLLELSNGCCALGDIESIGLRFILCAGMLAFGGLCVTMQTASVIRKLSLGRYLAGKLLQTLFSLVLAFGVQLCFAKPVTIPVSITVFLPIWGLIGVWILRKRKNNSSNPRPVGV